MITVDIDVISSPDKKALKKLVKSRTSFGWVTNGNVFVYQTIDISIYSQVLIRMRS